MFKKFSFVVLSLIFAISAFAGENDHGIIKGTVIDGETNQPLRYADVFLNGTNYSAITNDNGEFEIKDVEPGDYTIQSHLVGYKIQKNSVSVNSGQTVELNFALDSDPFRENEVVITGTRTPHFVKDAPVRVEVLTDKELDMKNAWDLYTALDGTPGVRVEQQCSACNFSELRMQGLGANHTQVLIDGEPVYSGLASVYGLQQIGMEGVDQIEIVKGAGSALYGANAVAGAINIVSKKPTPVPKFRAGLEFGENNTNVYSLSGSVKKGKYGIQLSAQKFIGDIIDESRNSYDEVGNEQDTNESDGVSDRVKTDATNLHAKFYADDILGNDELTVGGKSIYEHRQGGELTGTLYEDPFAPGSERIITKRYETDLTYTKNFNQQNQIIFSLAYSHHDRNATNDTYLGDYESVYGQAPPAGEMQPYIAEEDLYAVNITYRHPIKNHTLLVGAQFSHNELEESGRYINLNENVGEVGESYTSFSEKSADEFGVFLQDEIKFNKLEIVGGVRFDMHTSEDEFNGSGDVQAAAKPVEYDESSVNPRLAIKYAVNDALTLRTSVGTGFRVPYGFSEDLHLCSGSPRVWKGSDLEAEKSRSYTFGVDYSAKKFTGGINLFRTDLENKIDFAEIDPETEENLLQLGYDYKWENVDNAFVQGIELNASYALTNNFIVDADFTVNQGEYENERSDWAEGELGDGKYYEDSKYISRFPQYTGGLKLDYNPDEWGFILDAEFTGPMYIDFAEVENGDEASAEIYETETFVILNAKVSRNFYGMFDVYIGAKNLTNYIQEKRYVDDAAFIYAPLYGRIAYGGIKFNF
jgi:outer membrane receptor for ferrienterochelin and colicins